MSVVLVTGAAGFIGSHVTERLLTLGHRVVGVDNFDSFYPRVLKERNLAAALTDPRFTLIEADLRDFDGLLSVWQEVRPERVIHLAAKAGVRPSIQAPQAYVETNVGGTLNVIRAIERYPAEHLVFASSSSVYGNSTEPPFSEEARTDEPASPYAATKKAGECLLYTYHQLLGVPVTCLRFFTVFGPRQRPDLAINKFVRLIDAGEPIPFFGDGSTSRDYTYVQDSVDGILAALERPAGYQVFNLGRNNPVSLTELVETIERVMGKQAVLDRQPDQAGDVRTTCADTRKARAALGYEAQVSLEEGIRRFVDWWRSGR